MNDRGGEYAFVLALLIALGGIAWGIVDWWAKGPSHRTLDDYICRTLTPEELIKHRTGQLRTADWVVMCEFCRGNNNLIKVDDDTRFYCNLPTMPMPKSYEWPK